MAHGWVGCNCGKLAACEDSDNGALRCGPNCCFGEAIALNVPDLGRIQERLQLHYNERIELLKRELKTIKQYQVGCTLCGWTGVVGDLKDENHGHCPECQEHL